MRAARRRDLPRLRRVERAHARRRPGVAVPPARRRAHLAVGPRRGLRCSPCSSAAPGTSSAPTAWSCATRSMNETDGNPFFVTESLRDLAESGAIRREDGRWVVVGDVGAVGLPATVREVVEHRVARLGTDVQRVLQLASVMGRDFELGLLADVADADEESVLVALETADAAALVRPVADGRDEFTFAHALIEHTLYEQLSPARRRRAPPARRRRPRRALRRRARRPRLRARVPLDRGRARERRSTAVRARSRRACTARASRRRRRSAGSRRRCGCSRCAPTRTSTNAAPCSWRSAMPSATQGTSARASRCSTRPRSAVASETTRLLVSAALANTRGLGEHGRRRRRRARRRPRGRALGRR